MNQRERWLAAMHFQPVDHVPDQEFMYWRDTLAAWHSQGLPEYITDNVRADAYFGFGGCHFKPNNLDFAQKSSAPLVLGLWPRFEYELLEEDSEYQIFIDSKDGAKKMLRKDSPTAMPKFLKFPLETREDWDQLKKRLDVDTPGRWPDRKDWEAWKVMAEKLEQPVGIPLGSLFGCIRDWMGFENVCLAIMDDPGFVQEIMEHLTNLIISVITPALKEVKFDFGGMWEDMCFNHGSMLQPKYFEEWMVPRLKRITGLLAEHGCDIVYVDCDGKIEELVPLWLEAGVNLMLPIEMAANTDPVELREKYGHRILLMGGVDKRKLIAGKEEIRRELLRLKPLVEDGGYIPHVDHLCPPDVTFENYLYYLKMKREIFGIPEPQPWETRKEQYEWAR